MATKKTVRLIRVKALQEGDVYEGTAEEVQPAMDNGYVGAADDAVAGTDVDTSAQADAAPAAGG